VCIFTILIKTWPRARLIKSIQGASNSATQFQARMTQIFTELLFKSLIIWIDDLLGHADSEENGSPF